MITKQQIRKDYLQKLPNGDYVFDFHKIHKHGFPYNMLMTERGAGKDFNAKEFLLDEYNIKGYKSVWVYNTQEMWDRELLKFLSANRQINPKRWEGVEITKRGLKKGDEIFCEFVALSSGLKGSRDMGVKHLVYNEMNERMRTIGNKQTSLLSTLINTFKDAKNNDGVPLTIWLFGNSKSLFLPLFIDLKIWVINEEITDKKTHNGNKFMKIIAIKPDIQDVEERYKNDPHYYFDKITGEYEHNYLNNFFDNINGIERDVKNATLIQSYAIDGRYYNIYLKEDKQTYWYALNEDNEPTGLVITWDKKSIETGVLYKMEIKAMILELLATQRITFDSVASKTTLLNSL